jgi:hypothetical protein
MQASAKTAQEFFASTRSFIAQGCLGSELIFGQGVSSRMAMNPGSAGNPAHSTKSVYQNEWVAGAESSKPRKASKTGAFPSFSPATQWSRTSLSSWFSSPLHFWPLFYSLATTLVCGRHS